MQDSDIGARTALEASLPAKASEGLGLFAEVGAPGLASKANLFRV